MGRHQLVLSSSFIVVVILVIIGVSVAVDAWKQSEIVETELHPFTWPSLIKLQWRIAIVLLHQRSIEQRWQWIKFKETHVRSRIRSRVQLMSELKITFCCRRIT